MARTVKALIKDYRDTNEMMTLDDFKFCIKEANYHLAMVKQCDYRNPTFKTHLNIAAEIILEVAACFNDMDAAEEVLPGISKQIMSGEIKPTINDVAAIAKAPVEQRKDMAEQLYVKKELSDEEKKERQNKRDLMKTLKTLDATHMADGVKQIDPDNILDIFHSEIDKVIDSMNFCFDYFPQILKEQQYLLRVKELVKILKDYISDLEENRYED